VRGWLLIPWLVAMTVPALGACAASRTRQVDGGPDERDAGSLDGARDAGLMIDGALADDGVGPACTRPPSMPCVVPAGDGVLTMPFSTVDLYGLDVGADGARVLFQRHTDGSPGTSFSAFWETAAFGTDLRAGPVSSLEVVSGFDFGAGSSLRLATGEVHLAWRVSLFDPSGMGVGNETHEARFDLDGVPVPLPAADRRDELDDWTDPGLAQTDEGLLVVAHRTARGLAVRSATRESTVPLELMSTRNLEFAALSGGRLVAVVELRSSSPDLRRIEAVVLDRDFGVQAQAVVFDGPSSSATLLVMGDDIYVARFDRLFDRLDESRLRIAHLDDSLERVEPDRALDGWGGLEPTYSTLVAWRGAPWLVWRTIDVRFGATPVLYALPLTEEACRGSVSQISVTNAKKSVSTPRSGPLNAKTSVARRRSGCCIAVGCVPNPKVHERPPRGAFAPGQSRRIRERGDVVWARRDLHDSQRAAAARADQHVKCEDTLEQPRPRVPRRLGGLRLSGLRGAGLRGRLHALVEQRELRGRRNGHDSLLRHHLRAQRRMSREHAAIPQQMKARRWHQRAQPRDEILR